MKHLSRILAFLLAAVCVFASGCQACSAQEDDTFVDALGQEIAVRQPQRVVALMGSFAHMWLLAGGEESLCGMAVDTTDTRDLGIPDDIVSVGTYQNPNMEAILSLDPQLVLLSADTVRTNNHLALRDSLHAAGIPAAYFKVTHFEDYLQMLHTLCSVTGDMQAYERHGKQVKASVERIIEEGSVEGEPTVLLMITYSGGVRVQNADTMTGRMLAQLGCRNVLDEYPSLLKDFSMEKVIEIDPDYIFVIPMGNDDAAVRRNLMTSVESNPAWNGLTAVQQGRYIILPGEKFLYKPNDRWDESYGYLAHALGAHAQP
ncbi:MAG: ABC transporter substrate-binding protein [Clostridia bacterium]|nr:ABC transporter substrate-binding protein [Clostridia bacterium]